jgi:hypothetical protein
MKQLSDYNPHMLLQGELTQLHTSYRDMAVMLPSRLVRVTPPGEFIEVPSASTLRRIAQLLRLTSRCAARRGAQTKNKRTRGIQLSDGIIPLMKPYATSNTQAHESARDKTPSLSVLPW